MNQIKIGTIVHGDKAKALIPKLAKYDFETYNLYFFGDAARGVDWAKYSEQVMPLVKENGRTISSVSIFLNPLVREDDIETWQQVIDCASKFGCDTVTGFTGRIVDRPIDESIPRFKEVFSELASRAADKGVRIAFENWNGEGDWYRGDWNIAHSPSSWELMFDALPLDNLGLLWEPAHQMVLLIDPVAQLRKWVGKIFHLHGKDANVFWDVVRERGVGGPDEIAIPRTPGFGDLNWADIFSILHQNGFNGSVDIEGFHDPVYNGEWEFTAQLRALEYLKTARGGNYVPNPW
ncbi:MAG: sugar phosphate isomerase/epimerase [Spirochaetales bacterium]|jgi:sugar phosphate isomerase/epimerase|nr:sugar phosphate isomerase/epimerase [Spirochaetales bacterium]